MLLEESDWDNVGTRAWPPVPLVEKKDWLTVSVWSVCRTPGSDAGRGPVFICRCLSVTLLHMSLLGVLRRPGINQGFHVPLQGGEWECADPQGPHSHRYTPLGGPLWREADHWDWWVCRCPFQNVCPVTSPQWLCLEPVLEQWDLPKERWIMTLILSVFKKLIIQSRF